MILDDIRAKKQIRLDEDLKNVSIYELIKTADVMPRCRDFFNAVKSTGTLKVIAEVKKASPSKGIICNDFDPVQIAKKYEAGGAAAISVLCEQDYFMGDIDYISKIKKEVSLPILCKDFIFTEYQIAKARVAGADAVLLIAAMLTPFELLRLTAFAKEFSMEVLLEAHNEYELEACIAARGKVIGINNRNLNTFEVDKNTFASLSSQIPSKCVKICESGIFTSDDARLMADCGADAVLVGESLMRSDNIERDLKSLRVNI